MVEPTESEDLAELDRFCDAMIAIRNEIDQVASGRWTVEAARCAGRRTPPPASVSAWSAPTTVRWRSSRPGLTPTKYWPPVARINQAYGDRNLVCSCPPPEAFAD